MLYIKGVYVESKEHLIEAMTTGLVNEQAKRLADLPHVSVPYPDDQKSL